MGLERSLEVSSSCASRDESREPDILDTASPVLAAC
jgi:hypothetical protein